MPQLPDGYYAVLDPNHPETMTYWRIRGSSLSAWPAKAWYGPPRPLKRDAPTDHDERITWIRTWNEHYRAWQTQIRTLLEADPGTALRRFAEFSLRCCHCGRALTDDASKVVGIGPQCRRGLPAEFLALVFTPEVAAAHAAHLADSGACVAEESAALSPTPTTCPRQQETSCPYAPRTATATHPTGR